MKWAIYLTSSGTDAVRPVKGLIDLADEPADTLFLRLQDQIDLLAPGERVILVKPESAFLDLDNDDTTFDYTVDTRDWLLTGAWDDDATTSGVSALALAILEGQWNDNLPTSVAAQPPVLTGALAALGWLVDGVWDDRQSTAALPVEYQGQPADLVPVQVARRSLGERVARYRARRDALLIEAMPYANFGRAALDNELEDWLNYVADLRALPDEPADPEAVVFPTAPSTSGTGGVRAFNRIYRRGNVIGDVSQILGVPTGALMEKGSNANGWYRRFACGLQICGTTINAALTPNIAVGQIFRSGEATWTFPMPFTDTETPCHCDPLSASATWGKARRTSTTTAAYEVYSAVSIGSALGVVLKAIGRWY